MSRERISLLFVSDSGKEPRVFRCRPLVFYLIAAFVLCGLVVSVVSTYFLGNMVAENRALRSENSELMKDRAELVRLTTTLERIKKDEAMIRSFLGLERSKEAPSTLGQGGMRPDTLDQDYSPASYVPSSVSRERVSLSSPLHEENPSRKALALEESLNTIVSVIKEKKRTWDHTPSIVPLDSDIYWVTSEFGRRVGPLTGVREFHNGIDITGRPDSPVISPAKGKVTRIGRDYCLGTYVEITHKDGLLTMFGHLSKVKVKKGMKVERGQTIGVIGRSGRTTGTHLHYTVKVDDRAVNPRAYMLNMRESFSLFAGSPR